MNNDRRGFLTGLVAAIGTLVANLFGMFSKKPDPTIAMSQKEMWEKMKLLQFPNPSKAQYDRVMAEIAAANAKKLDWAQPVGRYHGSFVDGEFVGWNPKKLAQQLLTDFSGLVVRNGGTMAPLGCAPMRFCWQVTARRDYRAIKPLFGFLRLQPVPEFDALILFYEVVKEIVAIRLQQTVDSRSVLCPIRHEIVKPEGIADALVNIKGNSPQRVMSRLHAVDMFDATRFNEFGLAQTIASIGIEIADSLDEGLKRMEDCSVELWRTEVRPEMTVDQGMISLNATIAIAAVGYPIMGGVARVTSPELR